MRCVCVCGGGLKLTSAIGKRRCGVRAQEMSSIGFRISDRLLEISVVSNTE